MVRVSKGIGKVIGALLWGSNHVCTKPNRSFAFRTDPLGQVCVFIGGQSLVNGWAPLLAWG